MNENERKIVEELNHPLYTPEVIERWEGWNGSVFNDTFAAIQVSKVRGFIEAVKQMAKQQKTKENKNEQ